MTGRNDAYYQSLYDIARRLHHDNRDIHRVSKRVISMTGEAVGVQYGCIVTFDDNQAFDNAYIIGAGDTSGDTSELWDQLVKRGLVGYVQHGYRTVVIRNIQTDPRWPVTIDISFIPESGSAVGLPLGKDRYIYGVMMLFHPVVDYFDQQKVEFLEQVAGLASAAMENALDFQRARTQNPRYEALFEHATVPILLTDLRGFIIDINQKASDFLGYERDDLLHRPITTIHDLDEGRLNGQDFHDLQPEQELSFRTEANTAEGERLPVVVRARRIQYAQRDVIEWVEQDVTSQMELEQLRRDLTAMVYHDLRGPLQTIKGSLYKLGQVLANHDNPAVLTLLQVGIRSTRQLQRMVDSLVDIQRLEEGRAILDRQPVELRVLLADTVQLVQPLAIEANQRLQFEVATNLPLVSMDNDMIMRVITNLLENAIKYTPNGGIITLTGRISGDSVRISVQDSGAGIPPDMQHQIFDKFNRVKYTDGPKGVGLGLAFCRLAVEAHEGRIWVESEAGKGSEFIITLPLDPEESEADPQSELALV
jgi:PAS domain S-box-containing protein